MATDTRIFIEVFEDIVESMRSTGTITASSEVTTIYTIVSGNDLSEGDLIEINDINYIAESVTTTQFNITALTGIDFVGEEWKALAPYSMYGHPREIAGRLSLLDKKEIEKFGKFPLIVLITDLEEDHDTEHQGIGYIVNNPKFVIVTNTNPTYTSPERKENTFKPILLPLYYDFISKIKQSNVIQIDGDMFPHKKYDRYAWGSASVYGNEGLVFNEFLDAVEIDVSAIKLFTPDNICQ